MLVIYLLLYVCYVSHTVLYAHKCYTLHCQLHLQQKDVTEITAFPTKLIVGEDI